MGRNKDPECPGFVSEHEKAESNGIGILQWSHLVQVVPFQSKAMSAGRERPLCACIAPLNLNIFFLAVWFTSVYHRETLPTCDCSPRIYCAAVGLSTSPLIAWFTFPPYGHTRPRLISCQTELLRQARQFSVVHGAPCSTRYRCLWRPAGALSSHPSSLFKDISSLHLKLSRWGEEDERRKFPDD